MCYSGLLKVQRTATCVSGKVHDSLGVLMHWNGSRHGSEGSFIAVGWLVAAFATAKTNRKRVKRLNRRGRAKLTPGCTTRLYPDLAPLTPLLPNSVLSSFTPSVIHRERGYKTTPSFLWFVHALSHSRTKAINYYCTIHNRHITQGNMNYVYTGYGCYGDTGYRSPWILLLWPRGAVVLKTRRFITWWYSTQGRAEVKIHTRRSSRTMLSFYRALIRSRLKVKVEGHGGRVCVPDSDEANKSNRARPIIGSSLYVCELYLLTFMQSTWPWVYRGERALLAPWLPSFFRRCCLNTDCLLHWNTKVHRFQLQS